MQNTNLRFKVPDSNIIKSCDIVHLLIDMRFKHLTHVIMLPDLSVICIHCIFSLNVGKEIMMMMMMIMMMVMFHSPF